MRIAPAFHVFQYIKRDIPFLKKFDTKIIVNVCGNTVEDYLKAVERLAGQEIDMPITGMRIDVKKRTFSVANKTGGLSGSAIKPAALRMVWQVCRAVCIPVIGMGGTSAKRQEKDDKVAG